LPRAADRSLLSWQGMHKSVIYFGALRCYTSNIILHRTPDRTISLHEMCLYRVSLCHQRKNSKHKSSQPSDQTKAMR